MAGYSGTPLIKKLGIKAGSTVLLSKPPDEYFNWLGTLPDSVKLVKRPVDEMDFIHVFVNDKKSLQKEFRNLKERLAKDGMLWVSWPKKASGVPTDLNENIVREVGLAEGLVDVKVCAVSEVWSGLKFMFRLKDR